jgi:hypothetical protein
MENKSSPDGRADGKTEGGGGGTAVAESGIKRALTGRSAELIKIEKNLASLGFFTPSSKRIKGVKKKSITFAKVIDGKRVEARATILPSAEYGLPITGDQDKYLALQKIITDIRLRIGEVRNPVGFTSAELLRILGKRVTAGKNYDDIEEWLKRMTLTGIHSEGTVYFAGRRVWASDTFHVFERSVSFGSEMPDGTSAQKNYIWLSEWQLENINSNHLLPVDLETYRQLKNHIAKTIVPLLQIWLYASRDDGYFEKRYDELCQIMNMSQYRHLSKIQEKLAPSLNELTRCGYLSGWRIEKTADDKCYKVVFLHGERFRTAPRPSLEGVVESDQVREFGRREAETKRRNLELVEQMVRRGISEEWAHKLVRGRAEGQDIVEQLEWGDQLMAESGEGKFYNPPGFYVYLLRNNIKPPAVFARRRREQQQQRQVQAGRAAEQPAASIDAAERWRRQEQWEAHKKELIDRYLETRYSREAYRLEIQRKKKEMLEQYRSLALAGAATLEEVAESAFRAEVVGKVPLPTFEEFLKSENGRERQMRLPGMKSS